MKKNESVHVQALHRKLDVVLVQILRYNCSETAITAFARIRPPSEDSALYPDAGFTLGPLQAFSPLHYFFRSAAPAYKPSDS